MSHVLQFTGIRQLEVVDRPTVDLAPGSVRIKVEAAGLCGSDVHGYNGTNDRRPFGVVMGHETVGSVVEISETSSGLTFGQRVAINPIVFCGACGPCLAGATNACKVRKVYGCFLDLAGGFATDMIVDSHNCVPVSAGIDPTVLTLIEPMAVGTHATRVGQIGAQDRVVVIGGGPIGLAVAIAVGARGAAVQIVEPAEDRRRLAGALGIESHAPHSDGDLPDEYDVAFECVGKSVTLETALRSVHVGGTVVALGLADATLAVPVVPLVVEERRIVGSSAYTSEDFVTTARYVESHAARLAPLVEHRTDLEGVARAFADYDNGTLHAVKTVCVPQM